MRKATHFLRQNLICIIMLCAILPMSFAHDNLKNQSIISNNSKVDNLPMVHNTKLDAMFKCFFGGENAASAVDTMLAETYRDYGTYMATIIIQHQIDYNMFLAFINGDSWMLKQFPNNQARHNAAITGDNTAMRAQKANIMAWLDSNYINLYTHLFSQFDHKPMADELEIALDKFIETNEFNTFGGDYYTDYLVPSEEFRNQQKMSNLDAVQKESDLIAYKVYLADMMLFNQLLKSIGVNIESTANEKLAKTYLEGYMPTVAPTAM